MNNRVKELLLIALFPSMMGATAGIAIPLGSLPSITLQTLFVYLAGLILNPRDAGISMLVYVLLGAIGVPIFSGFTGGMGILLSVRGGFIFGFIIVAMFVSIMKNVKILNKTYIDLFLVLVISSLLLYMIGGSYIAFVTKGTIWLVLAGFYVYLIGDFIKIFIAIHAYVRIRSHVTYERR
ncbi:biotin transporter BioY [Candidatus Xianfuyuplasma coldseepsis]|uniref:Biotin transporter n=1 Tax=Candidatus Xianfuyuplasma coldseepsis TaxID=2782163 RepID=A0A7L7KRI4_9MOLU|nr:biotin transporter BioY [Xianfuyuplasma coldseepsis]QMS85431.1 hypothetical protein G4Z02_06565 [Xianfuyuplasma coldseepsis]